ncbi:TPA: response regulator transcription factor [Salmonella enterica subsp. enterica serovar Saintpaul str. CFSAN004144]|nr:response regulator transcription factor [Salmonella enterica subsp. enterica serovar Saintpaul str. CFSAN004144]
MVVVTLKFFLARYNADAILTLPGILTSTELSILRMLVQGMNITEIARRRGRSVKTISTQKARLYRKLGIHDDLTLWLDLLFRYRLKLRKNEKNKSS